MGQAIAQLNDLIPTEQYDFYLNTSLNSIEKCAELIVEQIGVNPMKSFKQLSQQL